MEYTLSGLSLAETQLIVSALTDRPYGHVHELIGKLLAQTQMQERAAVPVQQPPAPVAQ